MSVEPAILYDRSRVTTDWYCPRKRYWNYEYDGKGIVGDGIYLPIFTGSVLHDGLSAIAMKVDIDDITEAAAEQLYTGIMTANGGDVDKEPFALEQTALTVGLLRGFHKHVWPRLLDQYPEVVAVEQEMLYTHDGLQFMSRPDLVLRDRDGCLWYIEYKSTSTNKESWMNSWSTAVQLHSTCRAVEATLGEKVTGVIIQGLYKGYVSYGKQSSPFCYAYHRAGNPPFSNEQFIYEYRAGFTRYPTWEMPTGVKGWVEDMPESILAAQFPQAPPIFINDTLIDRFFEQRAHREREIRMGRDASNNPVNNDEVNNMVLDMAFPQRFDQCMPAWGSPCSYRKLCHGRIEDPLTAGYTYREPHHTPEEEQWNQSTTTNGLATTT